MSDILDRLRDRDAVVLRGLFHAIPTMHGAANEIERLRLQLEHERYNTEKITQEATKQIKDLRAQVAKLESENENLCNVIAEYGDYCAAILPEDRPIEPILHEERT